VHAIVVIIEGLLSWLLIERLYVILIKHKVRA
jgi:hypothetical protein